jgi:hypothetical protein
VERVPIVSGSAVGAAIKTGCHGENGHYVARQHCPEYRELPISAAIPTS